MFKQRNQQTQRKPLTGIRLRSYAFALLTKREYSKGELIEKLCLYAENPDEVRTLVEELSENSYQSDQRVAEAMLSSQLRKGKGPNRIKLALKTKQLDTELIQDDLSDIDWAEQAYRLKVKNLVLRLKRNQNSKQNRSAFTISWF